MPSNGRNFSVHRRQAQLLLRGDGEVPSPFAEQAVRAMIGAIEDVILTEKESAQSSLKHRKHP